MGPKWPICHDFFFGTKHYYYFDLTIGPFHCAKFKNILTADPELWGYVIFGPKIVHLPQTKFFFGNYKYHSHLPIRPFYFAKFLKNFSSVSRVMGMCNFRPQNDPFPQMRIFFFFTKPVNKPCFFHSCLSTCQKSKSDINLLVKYWWLMTTEISLAKSHFWL